MFLSAPRHPILKEILANVVDIIKNEYMGTSVIEPTLPDKFLWLICSTGPGTFSASIRNIVGSNPANMIKHRFAGIDFDQLGGRFKWSGRMWNKDPNHYSHAMKAEKLLIQYAKKHVSISSNN